MNERRVDDLTLVELIDWMAGPVVVVGFYS